MTRTGRLRALAFLAGAVGIAGMVVSSIASATDAALAFGLFCVAGFIVLFVLGVLDPPRGEIDPLRGAALEELVGRLAEQGADEADLRRLVRLARGLER